MTDQASPKGYALARDGPEKREDNDVLVTGATGAAVGPCVVQALCEEGHVVRTFSLDGSSFLVAAKVSRLNGKYSGLTVSLDWMIIPIVTHKYW